MEVAVAKTKELLQKTLGDEILALDTVLENKFSEKLFVCKELSRTLVSFQDNKSRSKYRWYKFKEGFSASLVEYLLNKYKLSGNILDVFVGSGTTLFVASDYGLQTEGIEISPVCQKLVEARELLQVEFNENDIYELKKFVDEKTWQNVDGKVNLNELRITRGAYSIETKESIEKFLIAIIQEKNKRVRNVLEFSLLCVLESVSYTRKDGQYLRWDDRSGRREGVKKPFHKGLIPSFETAISQKINEIVQDLQFGQNELFKNEIKRGNVKLNKGSCLEIIPNLESDFYDSLITSPPYCNRYDYTRTYALELALLGIDEKGLSNLRQTMLSCTVENKAKDLLAINPKWETAIEVADNNKLLQKILEFLENEKMEGQLNNSGIIRMVRGYFYEMACVIAESARVLKKNAPLIMVNDNVRYAGISISVDLILSDFAENLGFKVENILVLPNGKGNSSQQMGEHGREVLRKCVYVWRKF
jgi:DNA modification methylase